MTPDRFARDCPWTRVQRVSPAHSERAHVRSRVHGARAVAVGVSTHGADLKVGNYKVGYELQESIEQPARCRAQSGRRWS